MMKHWKKNLFILFLTMVGITAYININTNENDRRVLYAGLVKAIDEYQMDKTSKIDLSSLTTFSWDRLYVIGPYTPPDRIDSILGTFWVGSRFTSIKSSDRITLLVFTKKGRVVQYLEFPRDKGDFSRLANGVGYVMAEARFILDESGRVALIPDP